MQQCTSIQGYTLPTLLCNYLVPPWYHAFTETRACSVISSPRSLVRDGQTSPHRPRLVVSRSTCPPLSSSPLANSFIIGTAVTNTHMLGDTLPAQGARAHKLGLVTTRPYDARRDAPPPQRTTLHNERSSETEGICPLFTLLLFLKSGTCNTWYLPVSQGSILFPPIIGNLNIATISHLASLSASTSSLFR
jgi:hypothetical protein